MKVAFSYAYPKEWELSRLKFAGKISSGSGFPHDYQGGKDKEIMFLKVSDMSLIGNEVFIQQCTNSVSKEIAIGQQFSL